MTIVYSGTISQKNDFIQVFGGKNIPTDTVRNFEQLKDHKVCKVNFIQVAEITWPTKHDFKYV